MTVRRSITSRPLTGTVAAAGLLLIMLGCGRTPAPEEKPAPSPGPRQLGVAVSSPTQPGWNLVKSDERETRLERVSAVDPAVASSRTLAGTTFGGDGDLLARLEVWKQSQLANTPGLKQDSLHFYRVKFKGLTCLQYDGSFEVVSEPKSRYTRFNFKGYLCPLGDAEQSVVELEVSNRATQKGFSDEMVRSANEFFEAAVFTPTK
jgi:hypothetical protein